MKKKYIIEVDESEIIEYWSEQGVKEIGYQEYALNSCPSIKVKPYEERPQGEWKVKTLSTFPQYQPDEYECPFCKTIVNYRTNFCHKCGAEMRKGGAE